MTINRVFTAAAFALVALGLILAFLLLGTPGHSRLMSLDEQRLEDLQGIALQLHARHGFADATLPARLPKVIERYDPSTKQPYEFHRLSDREYALCAVFAEPKEGNGDLDVVALPFGVWQHPAGHTCFKLNVLQPQPVDPALMPLTR